MTDTERHYAAVTQAISDLALTRARAQETLDDLCEGDDTDLMKLAFAADLYLSHAREALQTLNYTLAIRNRLEAEKESVA